MNALKRVRAAVAAGVDLVYCSHDTAGENIFAARNDLLPNQERLITCGRPQTMGTRWSKVAHGVITDLFFDNQPVGLEVAQRVVKEKMPCVVIVNSLHSFTPELAAKLAALKTQGLHVIDPEELDPLAQAYSRACDLVAADLQNNPTSDLGQYLCALAKRYTEHP